MGIFKKTIAMFFSNRTNLNILQFILYTLVYIVLMKYLTTVEFVLTMLLLMGIQFITHLKSVADGMVMNQLMNKNMNFTKLIKKIKEEAIKAKEEDEDKKS